MKYSWLAILIGVLLLASLFWMRVPPEHTRPKVFNSERAFFNLLRPLVKAQNNLILDTRKRLKKARVDNLDFDFVQAVAFKYQVDWQPKKPNWVELFNRVDVIAVDLALAQSAIESEWGRSRFAREGNNYFGMWCSKPGCGIVPKRRPAGATYEVRKYPTVRASVADYIHDINTNPIYAKLRKIRAKNRRAGLPKNGYEESAGLVDYSQRRETYVRQVRETIRKYKHIMF
ncbi:MAG: glucosaminidase domain-containing protein [Deltaproteobacteria bacterium]|nr:glucosaminidase domain-containing protein [Deltaproteobacteria bacterium]